ncbi:hypothetical protein V5097_02145 [Arenibacter palladensis]|uniref:hypothetical protein n=1 Tax=Arenibacter palladensis TaxID=237373 RepID=UPI002FCF50E0
MGKKKGKKGRQGGLKGFIIGKTIWWWVKTVFLGTGITLVLVLFGLYSGTKEILNDIIESTEPEPDYWKCEQDGNIRGIILTKNESFDLKEFHLGIGMDSEDSFFRYYNVSEKNSQLGFCFFPFIEKDKKCNFKFKIINENTLVIDWDIYDLDGCLAGKIRENQFVLNQDCQFTWNRDDYGFEVIDSDFNVLLSIIYRPPNRIDFQGLINGRGLSWFFYDNNMAVSTLENYERKDSLQANLKPVFEYFGKDWFGKRASSQLSLDLENK